MWTDAAPARVFSQVSTIHQQHRRGEKYNVPVAIESSDGYRGRGAPVDRTTQRWVRATGRRVSLDECSWLRGPVGDVDVIGTHFFARLADREGLTMVEDGPPRGLVEAFEDLAGPACDRFTVRSSGTRFGDPGFYFFVEAGRGQGWARYLKALEEDIRVYVDPQGHLRADHNLQIWGATFLRLHYRMRRKAT
jgi:hypothetical protein